jgi:hypothetical protein
MQEYLIFGKKPEKAMLNGFDGVIKPSEMLSVGSGPPWRWLFYLSRTRIRRA